MTIEGNLPGDILEFQKLRARIADHRDKMDRRNEGQPLDKEKQEMEKNMELWHEVDGRCRAIARCIAPGVTQFDEEKARLEALSEAVAKSGPISQADIVSGMLTALKLASKISSSELSETLDQRALEKKHESKDLGLKTKSGDPFSSNAVPNFSEGLVKAVRKSVDFLVFFENLDDKSYIYDLVASFSKDETWPGFDGSKQDLRAVADYLEAHPQFYQDYTLRINDKLNKFKLPE